MLAQGLRANSGNRDQRSKPRISLPFPADVRGKDDKGREFSISTVLDNVSGNGLYLRMMPCVQAGAKLSIVLRLLTSSDLVDSDPRFAIEGIVLRSEEKAGGARGVAVSFDSVRFM